MALWAIELSEFSIQYKPRLVLKGKVLAEFLVEIPQQEREPDGYDWWTLNVAEYAAIIAGINLAISLSLEKIIIRSDSQLVVEQVNGEYEIIDERMTKYLSLVTRRLRNFAAWQLEHVSRSSNEKVDTLVAVAAFLPIKETVLLSVYYQLESSITTSRVNEINEVCPSWMTPIVRYLSSGELLDNRVEGHKIQV